MCLLPMAFTFHSYFVDFDLPFEFLRTVTQKGGHLVLLTGMQALASIRSEQCKPAGSCA